jgi:hypothetical protein
MLMHLPIIVAINLKIIQIIRDFKIQKKDTPKVQKEAEAETTNNHSIRIKINTKVQI